MSSAEESQSGSDFEPDREQELESESAPDKHLNGTSRPNNPGTSKSADNGRSYPRRGRPKKGSMAEPATPDTPPRARRASDANKSPNDNFEEESPTESNRDAPTSPISPLRPQPLHAALQPPPPQGFLMPSMGPGGIPFVLPSGQAPGPMSGNERAQLYTILRQLPMGFPRPDGQAPGPIPFPFPIPPALMAAANISDSNERLAAAHEAEAPPESVGARSPAVSTAPSSPNKPRPEPGTLEWARQRKDNHKEVERRRRGNINEGINELARIIPNGHGDKAKSAVLRRAVDYLHQLKESEQKTMERWTMEKLTHEQVVGEWAARYKECAEQLEVERERREELEVEVGRLKLLLGEKEEDELAEDEEQVLDHEEEEDHRSGSGDERPTKRMRVA